MGSAKGNKYQIGFAVAVVLGLYSVIAFVLIGYQGKQFLTAYFFTVAAYVFFLCTVLLVPDGKDSLKNVFLGIPLWKESLIYAAVQTVLSFIVMLLPSEVYKLSVVLQLLLAGVHIILVCISFVGKRTIEAVDDKVRKKRNYLGVLQIEIDALSLSEASVEVKEALHELSETVRFSDPMSAEELQAQEDEILERISVLAEKYASLTEEEKMAEVVQIKNKMLSRNMKCRMLK